MLEENILAINSLRNTNAYLNIEEKKLITSASIKQPEKKISQIINFKKQTSVINNDNIKKLIGEMEEIVLINKENENVKKMIIHLKTKNSRQSKSRLIDLKEAQENKTTSTRWLL